MISVRRILKDYDDSGALHTRVGVQSAIGEGVFVTKSGDLLMMLALHGPDYECLDGKDLEATGVKPDILVINSFEDKLNGRDPQLDRAIEELMKQLK